MDSIFNLLPLEKIFYVCYNKHVYGGFMKLSDSIGDRKRKINERKIKKVEGKILKKFNENLDCEDLNLIKTIPSYVVEDPEFVEVLLKHHFDFRNKFKNDKTPFYFFAREFPEQIKKGLTNFLVADPYKIMGKDLKLTLSILPDPKFMFVESATNHEVEFLIYDVIKNNVLDVLAKCPKTISEIYYWKNIKNVIRKIEIGNCLANILCYEKNGLAPFINSFNVDYYQFIPDDIKKDPEFIFKAFLTDLSLFYVSTNKKYDVSFSAPVFYSSSSNVETLFGYLIKNSKDKKTLAKIVQKGILLEYKPNEEGSVEYLYSCFYALKRNKEVLKDVMNKDFFLAIKEKINDKRTKIFAKYSQEGMFNFNEEYSKTTILRWRNHALRNLINETSDIKKLMERVSQEIGKENDLADQEINKEEIDCKKNGFNKERIKC